MARALELLNTGKFHCIIVKDLSRFGRDHIQVGNYIEHIFPAMGIRVISVNDHYDSNEHIGAPGGIDIAIKNLIYELYSKDLSQKVKAARRTIMKTGKYNSPFAMYGYLKSNGSLVIDNESGAIVRRIFDMLDSNISTTQVAAIFNDEGISTPAEYKEMQQCVRKWNYGDKKSCWTDVTIRRIAADERYTGNMVSGKRKRTVVGDPCSAKRIPAKEWVVVPNTHPALVSQEKFDRVGERIHIRNKHRENQVNHKPSIYRCGNCGHALQKTGSKNITLRCRYSIMNHSAECLSEGINLNELLDILKMILEKQFCIMQTEAANYKAALRNHNGMTVDEVEKKLAQLKAQRFHAYERYKNGDCFRQELDTIREKIAEHMNELEAVSKSVDEQVEASEIKTHKADVILNYGNEQKFDENFIQYFVKEVRIFNDKRLEVQWNFGLDEFLEDRGGQVYEGCY